MDWKDLAISLELISGGVPDGLEKLFSDIQNKKSYEVMQFYSTIMSINYQDILNVVFRIEKKFLEALETCLQKRLLNAEEQQNILFASYCLDHFNIFKLLLEDSETDPSAHNNELLILSCNYGHVEAVKLLLQNPRVNPAIPNNYTLIQAIKYRHTPIVQLLLQDGRVDPSIDDNEIIIDACYKGYIEIIPFLLQDPRVDPSAQNNVATAMACLKGYIKIVKLLLQDPRVASTFDFDYIITYERSSNSTCYLDRLFYHEDDSSDMIKNKCQTTKFINTFMFKRYLESKFDKKTSSYITDCYKENMPDVMYKKDEINKIFEDYFRQFEDKIITI